MESIQQRNDASSHFFVGRGNGAIRLRFLAEPVRSEFIPARGARSRKVLRDWRGTQVGCCRIIGGGSGIERVRLAPVESRNRQMIFGRRCSGRELFRLALCQFLGRQRFAGVLRFQPSQFLITGRSWQLVALGTSTTPARTSRTIPKNATIATKAIANFFV